ncbi:MAG: APC family permease [Alphaproteobacteria bacterium]|nr:APC family permease [Alphaproteobacteria bacterium]
MSTTAAPHRTRGHLLKILGIAFGIAISVGNMIGSGILRAPASIASTVPDTALIMALWVLGGLHVLLTINIEAELATAVPQSGGHYLYAHRAFGDVAGLVVGWSVWMSKLAGIASASIAAAEFLPLLWPAAAGYRLVVALLVQLLIYSLNALGLREGRVIQEGTSLIKTLMLIAFVGAAFAVAAPAGVAAPVSAGSAIGWAAIIGAYALIKGAYSGFDSPVYFTEENERPSVSIPWSLAMGLLTSFILYVAVNGVLIYALGLPGVAATPLPFNTILTRVGGVLPGLLFAAGAIVSVAGVVNSGAMSAPRILFALSRNGLLPGIFQSVNKGGSPDMAMLATAVASLALAATGSFALVFGLIALMDTVVAVLIDSAFFVLRRREPELVRPFRARGYPLLPALLLAVDLVLLVLFAASDHLGLGFAVVLTLASILFAAAARRTRNMNAAKG